MCVSESKKIHAEGLTSARSLAGQGGVGGATEEGTGAPAEERRGKPRPGRQGWRATARRHVRPRPAQVATRRSPKRGTGWGAGVSRRGAHVPGRLGDGSLPLGSSALLNPARLRRRRHRGGAPAGSGAGAAAGGTWGRLATGGRGGSRAGERRQAWDSLLLWLLGGDGLRGGEAGRGLRLRRGGERKPWDRLRLRLQLGDGGAGGRRRKGSAGRAQLGFPQYQKPPLRVTRGVNFHVSKCQHDTFHPRPLHTAVAN